MILVFLACAPRPALPRCPDAPHLLLTTTDYEVGALATVAPDDGCVADLLASTGPDAVVRAAGDRVVVLNRTGGDTVRLYVPGAYDRPESELLLDRGGNPHDVARVGDEYWFTLYERAEVVRTDLDGNELGRVDLADQADGDGIPEADRLVLTDAGLFLALQQLDRDAAWVPAGGRIVRLDPDRAVVAEGWDVGPNPKLFPDPSDPSSMIVLTGRFSVSDGVLSRFDPVAGTLTPLLDEAGLGRDLAGFAGVGGYGVVLGVDFAVDGPSTVDCVDLATGGIVPGVADDAWYVEAVAADDRVYVAVRSSFVGSPADAVLAVDPVTCAIEPLAEGFAFDPYAIAWVP